MVDPGVLDITIHQGATFTLDLQYKDSAGQRCEHGWLYSHVQNG